MALKYSDYGYHAESGRIVMDGPAQELANNEDVKDTWAWAAATRKLQGRQELQAAQALV